MNYKEIKKLVKLLKDEDLAVLSVSDNDTYIHIEQKNSGTVTEQSSPALEPAGTEAASSGLVEITAGQIGTFYNQKDENSDETFVSEGSKISKGDQVGFIEAMKVFNDVKSNVSGTVEEIAVSNGDAVEFGDVLLRVRPEEA